jgi:hypothetical protein
MQVMETKRIPRNLGKYGYLLSLSILVNEMIGSFVIYYYDFKGFLIWFLVRMFILFMDYKTSNALEYNILIMQKNGFDGWRIFKQKIFEIFLIESLAIYIIQYAFIPRFKVELSMNVLFNRTCYY